MAVRSVIASSQSAVRAGASSRSNVHWDRRPRCWCSGIARRPCAKGTTASPAGASVVKPVAAVAASNNVLRVGRSTRWHACGARRTVAVRSGTAPAPTAGTLNGGRRPERGQRPGSTVAGGGIARRGSASATAARAVQVNSQRVVLRDDEVEAAGSRIGLRPRDDGCPTSEATEERESH